MTFDSGNREAFESSTLEDITTVIRTAMENDCIHPVHVFDAVDEALDRLAKQKALLIRIHDYLGELIKDNLVDDTPRASDLADDVWDAIHIGEAAWKRMRRAQVRWGKRHGEEHA